MRHMALIDETTRTRLRERLAVSLQGAVELRLYRKPDSGRLILPGGLGCATCSAAEELVRELADAAPDRISLTVIDVTADPELKVKVEVPAITVAAPDEEPRITFQGVGFENVVTPRAARSGTR